MTRDDASLVLSLAGILLSLSGVYLAGRAIWVETHKRGLQPRWLMALERARVRARRLRFWERPKPQVIHGGMAAHTGTAVGGFTFTGSARGHAPPLTFEELRAHVDMEIASVREAITAQANDAAKRIDAVNQRLTESVGAMGARMDQAEKTAALIDTHTLDRQMWGLLCVALGSILQAIAVIVAP